MRMWQVVFDGVAMATFPWLARLCGYTFAVGRDEALQVDAKSVLQAVYGPLGGLPPPELAAFGAKYDEASTWIVAYRHGQPVGCKALLDVRLASVALDVRSRRLDASWDAARVREISRLAILPGARGGRQIVMVGLLREMLQEAKRQGVTTLLAGSDRGLFRVYARYNPTACIIDLPPVPVDPVAQAYHHYALSHSRDPVLFTFEVAGASPWSVFQRFLTKSLRPRRPRHGQEVVVLP